MPVTIRKVDGFRVSTPGGVKAKRTTKAKAQRQKKLLDLLEKGFLTPEEVRRGPKGRRR